MVTRDDFVKLILMVGYIISANVRKKDEKREKNDESFFKKKEIFITFWTLILELLTFYCTFAHDLDKATWNTDGIVWIKTTTIMDDYPADSYKRQARG